MNDIHKAIRKKFRLRNKMLRNMPHCASRHFNRFDLTELFGQLQFNVGAEIGVRLANFSRALCKANPNLKLYCIDPWAAIGTKYPIEKQNRYYQVAQQRLKNYNVCILRKTSMEALDDIADRELDFIFIDGNHEFEYVMLDIIYWAKKVKSGGIIACHDYYSGEKGVVNAVFAYVDSHRISPWYVTKELSPTVFWVNP